MRTTLVLCTTALLLATTPPGAAGYSYAGTLDADVSLVAVARGHLFRFDADQGDLIEAALAWGDASKDLDLRLVAPGDGCDVNPDPEVACIVQEAAASPGCIGSSPLTGPHGAESGSRVAPATGSYAVAVIATAAPGATAYSLTITVDGAAPAAVAGPLDALFLQRPHCKLG